MKYYLSQGIGKNGRSRFTASPRLGVSRSFGFGLPKNSPYFDVINKESVKYFDPRHNFL